MGTLTAKKIIDKAVVQLSDLNATRWTRAELLEWINDAQRTIVMVAPNSSNYTTTVQLSAGSRQSIPTDGWVLLDIYRNMGSTGTIPGRAVRLVSKEMLDGFNPDWHSDTQTTVVKNYVYDLQDQTAYWVYPPNDGSGRIQINYARLPVPCETENDTIYVSDILQTAILDYVLFRAISKDAEYAGGAEIAAGYLAAFSTALGQKASAEVANNPNQTLMPVRDPNVPGAQS